MKATDIYHRVSRMKNVVVPVALLIFVGSFMAFRSKTKVEDPVDGFVKLAQDLENRFFELTAETKFNVEVRGQVARELRWKDFPGLADEIIKHFPDGNQLVQVDVGEPALLVTRKSQFTTTGFFHLNAMKFTQWDTTTGKVWVLVEYPEGTAKKAELRKIRGEMKELAIQYLENRLPPYLAKMEDQKFPSNSGLKKTTVASVLFANDNNKGGGIFLFSFTKGLALCTAKSEYKLEASTWKKEYSKIFSAPPEDGSSSSASRDEWAVKSMVYCADGGPFLANGSVVSFHECMCGGEGRDHLVSIDKTARLRISKLLASLDPIPVPQLTEGKNERATRTPASQSPGK